MTDIDPTNAPTKAAALEKNSKGRLIAITGGAGSGKSAFSVDYALRLGRFRYFLASALALDSEMTDKIAAHREERGENFTTLEEPIAVEDALDQIPKCLGDKVLLWDCLTLWLGNCVEDGMDDDAILTRLAQIVAKLKSLDYPVIVVTNELGMGLVPMGRESRKFRNLAGKAGQILAAAADEAYLIVMGRALPLLSAAELQAGAAPIVEGPS